MSKNKRYRVDLTQSAIITDASTFPPEASSPDKNQRQQSVYPLRVYEGANFLPTAHGYKSYFGTESKLDATGLPDVAIEEILTYQTGTYATGLLALTDAGLYANFSDNWEVLLAMPTPPEANRSFQWTWCIINSILFLYRQDLDYVIVLEEYLNNSGLLMDTFNGMAVTPQLVNRPAGYPVGVFKFTPTTLNMAGQIGIFRAGSTLGFWDSDNAVAWSALNDLTDFTPDLTTLANITKLGRLRGNITTIRGMGKSFVVYATRSILIVREADESLIRFKADVVTGAVGVSYPKEVAVAMPDYTHFAWTNMGLLQIEDGEAKPIVPDFVDYVKRTRTPQYLNMLNNRYLCIGVMDPKFITGNIELSAQTVDPEDIDWDGVVSPGIVGDGVSMDGQEVCFTVTEEATPESGIKPYVILPLYKHWQYTGATIVEQTVTLGNEQVKVLKINEGRSENSLGYTYYPMKVETAQLATFEQDQLVAMEEAQRAVYDDKYANLPNNQIEDWPTAVARGAHRTIVLDWLKPSNLYKGRERKQFVDYEDLYEINGKYWNVLRFSGGAEGTITVAEHLSNTGMHDARLDSIITQDDIDYAGYGKDVPYNAWRVEDVKDLNLVPSDTGRGSCNFTPATIFTADIPEDAEPLGYSLGEEGLAEGIALELVQPGRLAYRLGKQVVLDALYDAPYVTKLYLPRSIPVSYDLSFESFDFRDPIDIGKSVTATAYYSISVVARNQEGQKVSKAFRFEGGSPTDNKPASIYVDSSLYGQAAQMEHYTQTEAARISMFNASAAAWNAEVEALRASAEAAAAEWLTSEQLTEISRTMYRTWAKVNPDAWLKLEILDQYELGYGWAGPSIAYLYAEARTTNVKAALRVIDVTLTAIRPEDVSELLYGKAATAPLEESTPMQWNREEELRGLMAVDEWWFNRNRDKDELDDSFLIGAADRVGVPLGMTIAEADALGAPYDVTASANWGNRYMTWVGSENWDPEGRYTVGANNVRQQQRIICGVTDPRAVPPLVIPPIVWDPWQEEIPPLTWLLSNGQKAPYYPTMYGAYVFDLQLGKWGKYVGEHKALIDYQAINSASGGSVPYESFMLDAGALLPDRSVALFTSQPTDSYVRYGKYQHLDSTMTQFREVVVEFAERANAMVTLSLSLNGKQLEYGYSDALLVKDALRAELLSDKVGAWGTVTVSGHYDLTRMVIKSSKAGDR